jgi:lipoprotein-anchoring transpeptidase ErfK/SrfK
MIRMAVAVICLLLAVPGGAAGGDGPKAKASPLTPERFAAEAATAGFRPEIPPSRDQNPFMFRLQVLLDRAHASPGVIDGYDGDNVRKAVAAFEMMRGLPVDGEMDEEVWRELVGQDPKPPLMRYTITRLDVRGPFTRRIPTDYGRMARLKRLGYRNAAEALAERFHMDLDVLHQLNPGVSFRRPGIEILVADPGRPASGKVERVVADKSKRQLFAYGADDRLIAAYPATIGSDDLPSPSGTHRISAVVRNAAYWYRPDVNFKQGNNDKPLRLPPGPNNPIGAVWIDLTEPTYGIHGTPDPSKIDKTNSHGCIRLANWDALELAGMVGKGVPVEFVD